MPAHRFAASLALSTALVATPAIAAPDVVASIKPVHSLVSAVMAGVGEPDLLIEGAASPHGYNLRPSEAAALQDADLVFWIGPDLETFLDGTLDTLSADAANVALMESDGATLLEVREGGAFEAHDHDHDHGHGADDHAHDDDHDHDHDDHAHDHDDHAHDDHDHDDHAHDHDHAHDDHGHDHAEHAHDDGHVHDAHLWLDPRNAVAFVTAIEAALSQADPENAAAYAENASATIERLNALEADVAARLAPHAETGFIVFHDAYQYFENRFDLSAAGAITVNPEVSPGPERLREIQERIGELGAACVFAEPQFEPRVMGVVTEGTEARSGVLDPLGATMTPGPDLYFDLIGEMASAFETCLSETG